MGTQYRLQVVEPTFKQDGVAVGWTLYEVDAGKVCVQVRNVNKYEIMLRPREWLDDINVVH